VLPVKAGKLEQEATDYVAAMLLANQHDVSALYDIDTIFRREIFLSIYPYLLTMAVWQLLWPVYSFRQKRSNDQPVEEEEDDSSNPLEFKVALIFAVLFVIFTFLTHFTLVYAVQAD
jgi:uncharacterized membrane protein (DUF4010 family)